MGTKISIIIPVYNAEKYLVQMLDSVLNQSFTDFEVVAVNDGSKDNSLAILNEYAGRDLRIKVIDKENTGVSDTRNIGIENATGEYICFADADDLLHPDYMKKMYDIAEKNNADMVVCGYVTFRDESKISYKKFDLAKNNQVESIKFLLDSGLLTSSWNKLIKINVLNDIRYDVNMTFGEDLFFCWKCFLCADKVYFTESELYFYRLLNEGATSKFHGFLYEKYSRAFEDLKNTAEELDFETVDFEEMDIFFTKRIPSFVRMEVRCRKSLFEKYHNLKRILNDDIITGVLNDKWAQLIENENKKNVKIFFLARKQSVFRLLLCGWLAEKKNKVAALIKK